MKFMLLVFGEPHELHLKSTEWIERMAGFMVRFDDELAEHGELVYSEVLEPATSASLVEWVDGSTRVGRGAFNRADRPLARYWVVLVPNEGRALELASSLAAVLESAVEVRQVMEQSTVP
ncbi:YciI family protein [Salinibacterium sp. ZJ450]|uniref:YciI family protein n=1 Tax=Salinibacterium sp. ZJ450 TaxID=2708338 RepID=UPI00141FEEF7|nr:YciI family protein [Salinibacterium sp. ZJ450]